MASAQVIDYQSISTPYKKMCQKGRGANCLMNTRGLCIEPVSGNIYVVERGNSRIQVFSPEGVHEFFIYPNQGRVDVWGICIMDGMVYVSDYHGGRLLVFTLDGDIISVFGKGFNNGSRKLVKMGQPMNIAVNKDGDIYVCEFGSSRILVLTNSRLHNHINAFKYSTPYNILFSQQSNKTFVGCENAWRYSNKPLAIENNLMGTYKCYPYPLCWFGDIDCEDNLILSDMRGHKILILTTSNKNPPQQVHKIMMTHLGTPMGIAVDRNGRIICVTSSSMYFF